MATKQTRRVLPPKLKITKFESTLLEYPPNVDTWICRSEICALEDGILNGGNRGTCWVCGTPMSETPEFAWTTYEQACDKVGIVPGEQVWYYNAHLKRTLVRTIGSKKGWSEWEPETPVRLEVASRR